MYAQSIYTCAWIDMWVFFFVDTQVWVCVWVYGKMNIKTNIYTRVWHFLLMARNFLFLDFIAVEY